VKRLDHRSLRQLWRCAAACAAIGLALAVWLFRQPVGAALLAHPYFAANDLVIRGAGPLLSDEDILAWLGVDDHTSLWQLVPPRVRARLEEHPLIAWAAVRREFPNRLFITVRERRPEAIAVLDRFYYLDRNGHMLGPLVRTHSRDYPVITGLTSEMTPGYRTWAYGRAVRLARLCVRAACLGGLSEINVHAERGIVVYPRYPKVAITLGWGSWREKLARADRTLQTWAGQIDQVIAVDLRYHNQVVVERRPLPSEKGPAAVSKKGSGVQPPRAAGAASRSARPRANPARAYRVSPIPYRQAGTCDPRYAIREIHNGERC